MTKPMAMLLAAAAAMAGCGSDNRRTLSGQAFYAPGDTRAAATSTRPTAPLTPRPDAPAPLPPTPPAATLPAATGATTRASTVPLAGGQYQVVGGVVAEVNGSPIYAGRVLAALQSELAAKARDMDQSQFRAYATSEIAKQINGLIRNELVFAAADRLLELADKNIADSLTMQFRNRLITEAGGSVELARQNAAEEGYDFDELVREQYRRYMTEVYYKRKVVPRIQISANDLRTYYQRHLDDQFTDHDQAHFQLIKIDPDQTGGMDAARIKAQTLRARALAGEDFSAVAASYNDNSLWKRNQGDMGWIERGAFKLEKVEKTLWQMKPGEVSAPIEESGAVYLAKLLERKTGKILPFDDPAVQEKIHKTLWSQQFRELTDQVESQLRAAAMVRQSDQMLATAIDMAMQLYPRWSALRP